MVLKAGKRKSSISLEPITTGKRSRTTSVVEPADIIEILDDDDEVIEIPDDDDDLNAILAQIKEQEDSERLVRQLQEEWEFKATPTSSASVHDAEGDEAMAKRLAEEWANEKTPEPNTVSKRMDNTEDDETIARRLAEEWACQQSREPEDESLQSSSGEGAVITLGWSPRSSASAGFHVYTDVSPVSKSSAAARIQSSSEINNRPPDEVLAHFRELFTGCRSCTGCGKEVVSPRGHVMFTGDTLLPLSLTFLLHSPCSSCGTNHCRGCFSPIKCPVSCRGPSKNSKCTITNCCVEGRAIAVFEALGAFDRQYFGERETSNSRAAALSKQRKPDIGSVGPGGTGYGSGTSTSSGSSDFLLGGKRRELRNSDSHQPSKIQESLATHWDEIVTRALNVLTELLPAPYSDTPQVYDLLPHPATGLLLSLSQLNELLHTLLRNDSVTDWISRSNTYYAMLALFRRMADSEVTIRTLIEPRWEMKSSCGIEHWMWGEGKFSWEQTEEGKLRRAPPLYDCFKKLTKQCDAFLAGASQMMNTDEGYEEDVDATIMQGTSLCGDIIAARDEMERAMNVLGSSQGPSNQPSGSSGSQKWTPAALNTRSKNDKGKARDASVDLEKLYSTACERLAFIHVPLFAEGVADDQGLHYTSYNYAPMLKQTQNSTRNPKDRLQLVKELAVMATSLPPGMWVRVDEVRNDAIKVMIAGPDNTPYAGGLFEFDCFMPMEYPQVPPLMHLRTTNGGAVRFNPNLYADGKVCLSLLGTWQGSPEENWSSKSTLLQVLVSIQSMILIETPYFNEPGYGKADPAAPASIAYNRNISLQNVRWAIVDWMRGEHSGGIWRDVIASHFSIRKDKIRNQIVQWAGTNHEIRAYSNKGQMKKMDLLQEFDNGMKRIQSWGLGT